MANEPDDDLDLDEGTEGSQSGETAQMGELRKQVRKLQKQVKDLSGETDRADKAERKLAFAEAGIDLSDKQMQYFARGYDGELDGESIKKAATEAGFLSEDKGTGQGQGQPPAPDTSGFDEVAAAVRGTPMPEGGGQDIVADMREIYERGGGPEDVARYLAARGQPVAQGFEG